MFLSLAAYVRPGRGDAMSGPSEVIQEYLINSLSSIPTAMFDDLSAGQLELGVDAQQGGSAAGRTGTLVSMNSLPSQLVCQPGAALVNGTQCGKCSLPP